MGKLDIMQCLADREAKKLGIDTPLTVVWSGTVTHNDRPCRVRGFTIAHAHTGKRDGSRGTICIQRGLADWRDTIKHEVAHFVPGGQHTGTGFLRARARQGSRTAKRELRARGKMRCSGHQWRTFTELDRKVRRSGIVVTHAAYCTECGKQIPKGKS